MRRSPTAKFGNKYCWVLNNQIVPYQKQLKEEIQNAGGIFFHSKKEAKRFIALKFLLNAKEIQELVLQPKYPLYGKGGSKICSYVADFQYKVGNDTVVEDTKGFKTADYKLKAKLFKDNYPGLIFKES